MNFIPGQTFRMGTAHSEVNALRARYPTENWPFYEPELPGIEVTVGAFWIDRTSVTNADFSRFVESNPAWGPRIAGGQDRSSRYLEHWRSGAYVEGTARHPVTFVSWHAAQAYCKWKGGRLPTEAEWELAASDPRQWTEFPWGDEPPTTRKANFAESDINGPVPVASYPPNARGVFDMAGNVWHFMLEEWRADYSKPLFLPPADSSQVTTRRAIRGGSWGGAPVNLRIRYRDSHPPHGAGPHVGFRCVQPAA